jgi:heptaprenyl diphosphate synthase
MALMDTHTKSHAIYIKKVAICGMLIACALVLSYVETLIPLPLPVLGIKLGIANAVSLIALYRLDGKAAMTINVGRIVLAGVMFSGMSAMLYALAGGILSVVVMIALKRAGIFSIVGVSVAGASAHIFGQIALAALVIQSSAIFMSLPILLVSAIASGFFVGYLTHLIFRHLPGFSTV